MAANQDILKAIHAIDQRIGRLQEIKRQLAEEFGIKVEDEPKVVDQRQPALSPEVREMGAVERKSRKQTLAEYLRVNGPTSRADIVENIGFPEGTVSYCLNDKTIFVQLQDGKWTLAAMANPQEMERSA